MTRLQEAGRQLGWPVFCHLEKLDTDWRIGGVSVLEGGAEGGASSPAYIAQKRISISNFKRNSDPPAYCDVSVHCYVRTLLYCVLCTVYLYFIVHKCTVFSSKERGNESSIAFREQLASIGAISEEENDELKALERNIREVHPIIDGCIFIGEYYYVP